MEKRFFGSTESWNKYIAWEAASPRVAFRGRFRRAATPPPIPHQHHTGMSCRKGLGVWMLAPNDPTHSFIWGWWRGNLRKGYFVFSITKGDALQTWQLMLAHQEVPFKVFSCSPQLLNMTELSLTAILVHTYMLTVHFQPQMVNTKEFLLALVCILWAAVKPRRVFSNMSPFSHSLTS